MRGLLTAAALSVALAGIGHNGPPAIIEPMTASESMQRQHEIKRRENKKLWQRRRRKPKDRPRYHKLTWSQRKGRLFKGHRP